MRASVSIVIPVHGRASLTRQCLEKVFATTAGREVEVVVVDDASRDSTPALLRSYGERVRVVTHQRNSGFALACNDGAAAASADRLVFLNNDTVPHAGWLDALDAERRRTGAGILGSRLLYPNGTIQHAGIAFTRSGLPTHLYLGFPADHPAVLRSRALRAVTGACLMVGRELFERLDGFDPTFVNLLEDVDFCLRAGELGHEIRYCAESVLDHWHGATRSLEELLRDPRREAAHAVREFQLRWSTKVEPDELRRYEEDGMLELLPDFTYPRTLRVSPLLAVREDERDRTAVERLLQKRSKQVFDLTAENVALRVRLEPPPSGNGSPSPAPTALDHILAVRAIVAARYVHGRGIEVGALHSPLAVPPTASVLYVDRLRPADLRRHYPELDGMPLSRLDLVDDGERLSAIRDASVDFVIASHFLEHAEDPIGSLAAMLRVVRPGGVVYLAIPDKRYTFDRKRPVTPFAHLVEDHERGPEVSRRGHYEEWTALAEDENIRGRSADELLALGYSIHFHVWTQDEMLELLLGAKRRYDLPFELEFATANGLEVVFVLRRTVPAQPAEGEAT